ncbi:MAG TPA: hypothetical protein VEA69_14795 [Tepidisphaeraceae bacterium]|nr:hypothetical protein [Tepidisphaeraceae bacterium]
MPQRSCLNRKNRFAFTAVSSRPAAARSSASAASADRSASRAIAASTRARGSAGASPIRRSAAPSSSRAPASRRSTSPNSRSTSAYCASDFARARFRPTTSSSAASASARSRIDSTSLRPERAAASAAASSPSLARTRSSTPGRSSARWATAATANRAAAGPLTVLCSHRAPWLWLYRPHTYLNALPLGARYIGQQQPMSNTRVPSGFISGVRDRGLPRCRPARSSRVLVNCACSSGVIEAGPCDGPRTSRWSGLVTTLTRSAPPPSSAVAGVMKSASASGRGPSRSNRS